MDQWKRANTNIGTNNFTANATVATFNFPCLDNSACTYYYSTLPAGYYKFEVWGAEGGGSNCNRGHSSGRYYPAQGKGGYSIGVYKLDAPSQVYVFIGGRGEDALYPSSRDAKGGYNGGGDSSADSDQDKDDSGGAGGGASDIRVNGISISDRVIVAGGAGGNGFDTCAGQITNCGYGGGEIASPPNEYSGNIGTPASQTDGIGTGIGEKGQSFAGGISGGGGGGYRGGYTLANGSRGSGGGGSGFIGRVISFNGIEKKTVPGNQPIVDVNGQTKTGNWGHGAARITLLGYSISIKTKIEPRYDPNSTLEIEYSLTTMGKGEQATVTRIIEGIETKTVLIHNDEGTESVHKDSITLPNITADIKITYQIRSLSGSVTSNGFRVIINKIPILNPLNSMADDYASDEPVELIAELIDDSYSEVILYYDDDPIQKINLSSYNIPNITKFQFNIRPDESGSHHNIALVAVDQFACSSDFINFSFIIIENSAPEIILNSALLYYFLSETKIPVNVSVRDIDELDTLCIRSNIDKCQYVEYGCVAITDSEFVDFTFNLEIPKLETGHHDLEIYCVDNHKQQSGVIPHHFVIDPRVECKKQPTKIINCYVISTIKPFIFYFIFIDETTIMSNF